MSLRIDTAELIAGAVVIGGTGLGVLGADVPSDGVHGASFLRNDVSLPADAAKEVRGLITVPPSLGTFFAWEDGSFTLTGATDGVHTFTYRLFVDGADMGTAIATITIGAGSAGELSGTATLDGVGVAGGIAGGAPSGLGGNAGLDSVGAGGGATGGTPSNLAGTATLGDVTSSGYLVGEGLPPPAVGTGYVVSAAGRRWLVQGRGHDAPESQTATWPAKRPSERIGVGFDFRADVDFGDSIALVQVAASTVRGTDPMPQAIIYGEPELRGRRVFQTLSGGVVDCTYLIECRVTTQAGRILELAGVLPVAPP